MCRNSVIRMRFNIIHGIINCNNCWIALRCTCHIKRRLRKHNSCLRHTKPLNCLCRRGRHDKSLWVSIWNILRRTNHDSSGNKFDVLTGIQHSRQIINYGIRGRAPHTFNKCRNGIVMIIPCFIIAEYTFLNTFLGNFHRNMNFAICTSLGCQNTKFNRI